MPDHARMLEVARSAVLDACAVCREVQSALDELRQMTKDDRSPVTVADFASQAIIGRALREAFGSDVIMVGEEDSGFLREEHPAHLDATVAAVREVWEGATADEVLDAIDVGAGDTHHAGFWTLDPIDGTKGFLRGQQYAIALAYVERGVPVVGVLGCPNLPRDFNASVEEPDRVGSLYCAIKGDGLYELPAGGQRGAAPVHIQRIDHAEGESISVCMSVEAAHSSESDTDSVLALLAERGMPTGDPVRIDSQCKYAVVGRGQADAYLRLPTRKGYVERIWDHAAGSLIATEGGAFVTDIHGNALDFTHGRGLEKNRGVVCAPPRVHGALIGAIEDLGLG